MAEQGLLAGIGWTRAVRLDGLAGPRDAEVWVKLEAANPTGSYKDRMALAMIRGGERSGKLRSGQIVVEATGGSTGASLALVCTVTGHPLRVVTSDAFAPEKIVVMRAFGAEVDVVPSPPGGLRPDLWPQLIELAKVVADQVDGFATDQFHNPRRGCGRRLLAAVVVGLRLRRDRHGVYGAVLPDGTDGRIELRSVLWALHRRQPGRSGPPGSAVGSGSPRAHGSGGQRPEVLVRRPVRVAGCSHRFADERGAGQ